MEYKLKFNGIEVDATLNEATGFRRDKYNQLVKKLRKDIRKLQQEANNYEMQLREEYVDVQQYQGEPEKVIKKLRQTDLKAFKRYTEFTTKYSDALDELMEKMKELTEPTIYEAAQFIFSCPHVPKEYWESVDFWKEQNYQMLDEALASFREAAGLGGAPHSNVGKEIHHSAAAGEEREGAQEGEKP